MSEDIKSIEEMDVLDGYFCGCGENEIAKILVADILKLYEGDKIEYRRDAIEDVLRRNSRGLYYFILYMLDHMELLEHGTSVNYAWLTEKGEKVIKETEECRTLYFQE